MVHQTLSYARIGGNALRGTTRSNGAGDARLNPWLLWRPERPQAPPVLTVAELAECRCPDICNRDHANE